MNQPIKTPGPIAVPLTPCQRNALDAHTDTDLRSSDRGYRVCVAPSTNDLFDTLRVVISMAKERHHRNRYRVGDESAHASTRCKSLRENGNGQPLMQRLGGKLQILQQRFQVGIFLEFGHDLRNPCCASRRV